MAHVQLIEAQLQKVIDHIDRLLAKWDSPSNPNQFCTGVPPPIAPVATTPQPDTNTLPSPDPPAITTPQPPPATSVRVYPPVPNLKFVPKPGTKPEICTEAENDEDDIPKLIEAAVVADSRSVLIVKSRPDLVVESIPNGSISLLPITCTKESFESPWGHLELRYAQKIFPHTNSMHTCLEQRDNFVDTGWNGSWKIFGMDAGKYLVKLGNICTDAAICTDNGNKGGYIPESDLSLEIKCHKTPKFRLFEKDTLKDKIWLIDDVLWIATFHSEDMLIIRIAASLNLSPYDLFLLLYRWRWMRMAGRTIKALPLEMEQVEALQGLLKSLSNPAVLERIGYTASSIQILLRVFLMSLRVKIMLVTTV